jgi:hypothetical protein
VLKNPLVFYPSLVLLGLLAAFFYLAMKDFLYGKKFWLDRPSNPQKPALTPPLGFGSATDP